MALKRQQAAEDAVAMGMRAKLEGSLPVLRPGPLWGDDEEDSAGATDDDEMVYKNGNDSRESFSEAAGMFGDQKSISQSHNVEDDFENEHGCDVIKNECNMRVENDSSNDVCDDNFDISSNRNEKNVEAIKPNDIMDEYDKVESQKLLRDQESIEEDEEINVCDNGWCLY